MRRITILEPLLHPTVTAIVPSRVVHPVVGSLEQQYPLGPFIRRSIYSAAARVVGGLVVRYLLSDVSQSARTMVVADLARYVEYDWVDRGCGAIFAISQGRVG